MSFCRKFLSSAAAVAAASALLLSADPAAAQEEATVRDPNAVSPTGKGITGGILLGAEAGLITVGAIGVKEWWAYLLAGAVGAGGGAVGGYFVEQVEPSEPSLFMLAGGLALVIPTVVVIANATAYDPKDDEEEGEFDSEGDQEPVDVQQDARWRRPPIALLDIDASGSLMRARPGVPAVSVAPMYTRQEVAAFQVQQTAVVHVPLIAGAF